MRRILALHSRKRKTSESRVNPDGPARTKRAAREEARRVRPRHLSTGPLLSHLVFLNFVGLILSFAYVSSFSFDKTESHFQSYLLNRHFAPFVYIIKNSLTSLGTLTHMFAQFSLHLNIVSKNIVNDITNEYIFFLFFLLGNVILVIFLPTVFK